MLRKEKAELRFNDQINKFRLFYSKLPLKEKGRF